MTKITFKDISMNEESGCGNCYELEPFTPIVDAEGFCLDCCLKGGDEMSKEDFDKVEFRQVEILIQYHEDTLVGLKDYMEQLILNNC
jgi:hypothetical protein